MVTKAKLTTHVRAVPLLGGRGELVGQALEDARPEHRRGYHRGNGGEGGTERGAKLEVGLHDAHEKIGHEAHLGRR